MDWARAIKRNHEALTGIVAALFALLGLTGGLTVARVPRELHRAVLRVLRPAESAVRRLVVIAARGLVVMLPPARPAPAATIGQGGGGGASFQLFDPRKRFAFGRRSSGARLIPRIHVFAGDPRVAALWQTPELTADPASPPEVDVDARRLCRRLHALKMALEDVPRQARRLARWRARRETMPSPKFSSPLRPGHPPGYRGKPVHEVDAVLVECHGLACDAIEPDTS